MDKADIFEYAKYLDGIEYLSLLDEGLRCMSSVVSWPEGKIPKKIQSIFPALCEYMAFNMGTKYPFFEAIQMFFKDQADVLFKHISDKGYSSTALKHDETFELLLLLSHEDDQPDNNYCVN